MNADSNHPLQQALAGQESTKPSLAGTDSPFQAKKTHSRPQQSPQISRVKLVDTSGIKIPMTGEERIVDVETEAARSAPPEWVNPEHSYKEIKKEKPAHRIIAYMAASGATTQRIADETGYGVQQVRILLNQSWMKAHIASLIHDNFNDDISGILKAGAVDAIMTIRNLSTESPNEKIRLSASMDLLDRYRGKATQFIHTSSSEVAADPSDEIARLQLELGDIATEEKLS